MFESPKSTWNSPARRLTSTRPSCTAAKEKSNQVPMPAQVKPWCAWLTGLKSAMSSSAWRNSCLALLVRPHFTPCIRSGNPVTMRRSGAASKSVRLIVVKMSKAISRSCKHLATPVPCKCCHIQKNAFLQFSTLSGTSCSGNAVSNSVRVLETRARKLSRSSSGFMPVASIARRSGQRIGRKECSRLWAHTCNCKAHASQSYPWKKLEAKQFKH